jgi:hypothetical protein
MHVCKPDPNDPNHPFTWNDRKGDENSFSTACQDLTPTGSFDPSSDSNIFWRCYHDYIKNTGKDKFFWRWYRL